MKALLVHPGTQHAFHLARQLERRGCLSRFWTGFAYDPETNFGRQIGYFPTWAKGRLSGRRLAGLPADKLRTRPLTELRALSRLCAGLSEQRVMFERNANFQRKVPLSELAGSDIIIGFDTASWLLADKALSLGRNFVLDQTTGHTQSSERLFPQLKEQFPEWMEDCTPWLPELRAAEDAEHDKAHRIVVGSSFARRTLIENRVPAERIAVAPLGVDLEVFTPAVRPESRPLRFVFVGNLVARKGVPLLLDVWRSFGNVHAELWLVGSLDKRKRRLIPELPGLRVLGKASRHALPDALRQCDVLVFPSYFEGFGAALLESMAAGLPVIATDATGAPDVMTNGLEGYVIPVGNAAALKNAMQRFMDSPENLGPMSAAARLCAERHSWDKFGDRWVEILLQLGDAEKAPQSPARTDTKKAGTEAIQTRVRREKTKVLLVHPGTQYSFQLARQLERHGCLNHFWTGMAYVPTTLLGRCIQRLPEGVKRQLSNRRLEGVPSERISIRPFGEWRAMQRLRAGRDDQTIMFKRNAAFQTSIPEREFVDSKVVIGFDTSSWLLAERAAALGCRFILDRSIGHPLSFERLVPALRQRFPEWVENFPSRLPNLLRAEEAEHRLADRIVVPSSFASETLIENGVPAHKIRVIPFGVDLNTFRPAPRPDILRPVRFIFLGALGVRKGVPVLFEAWRSLASLGAELWLAGSVSEKHVHLIPPLKGLKYIGKVPHKELPALLGQCDVLVFPSYFEGLAQVQLEALAAGLPIVATDASGATDLIADGREGYIIPVGDVEALREAMLNFIRGSADLAVMSPAARLCAEDYSWEAYGDRWIDLLDQVVHSDNSSSSVSGFALRASQPGIRIPNSDS